MAIKIPGGGTRRKVPGFVTRDFVPRGYLSLHEAIANVGKALFGESWTGDDTTEGWVDLETLKAPDRRKAVGERRRALFREQYGRDWRDGLVDGDLPQLSDADLIGISDWLSEKWKAHEQRCQRLDAAIGWFRQRLFGTPPDHADALLSHVLSADGRVWPLPPALWGSENARRIFRAERVEFHPGKYGWTWSPTAAPLKGRVLIKETALHKALAGNGEVTRSPGRATVGAERQCERWIAELASKSRKPASKEALWREAKAKWGDRLSRRGFNRAWANAAPDEWKSPGRKS